MERYVHVAVSGDKATQSNGIPGNKNRQRKALPYEQRTWREGKRVEPRVVTLARRRRTEAPPACTKDS